MWVLAAMFTGLVAWITIGGYIGYLLISIQDILMIIYLIGFSSFPLWVTAYLDKRFPW